MNYIRICGLALATVLLVSGASYAGPHNPPAPGQTQHQAGAVAAAQQRIVGLEQHADFYAANPSPHHDARLSATEAKIARQQAIIDANTP